MQLSGVLVINKPKGPTSHDVVNRVRRRLQVKVGHTGTLDPQATGVLPLMLGRAPRLMRFFSQTDKVYDAEIQLGKTTDTYDGQGQVLEEFDVPQLRLSDCLAVLDNFKGVVQQVPPMYSAIRVAGRRLYKEARAGRKIERPPREVTFYSIELLQQKAKRWRLKVHCSSGTYLRSLAHDIGKTLGCGAFLSDLARIRSGQFRLDQAIELSPSLELWRESLIPLEELLPELPRLDLTLEEANRVVKGNPVLFKCGQKMLYRLFHEGLLYAIGRRQQESLHPFVVLRTELVGS